MAKGFGLAGILSGIGAFALDYPINGYSFFASLGTLSLAVGFAGLEVLSNKLDQRSIEKTKKIDFFGEKKFELSDLSENKFCFDERMHEVEDLVSKLNQEYQPMDLSWGESSRKTRDAIQKYIKKETGQEIGFYHGVRQRPKLLGYLNAQRGGHDPNSSDISVNIELDENAFWIVAHEQAHRIGYGTEIDAQLISYNALIES
ncbi:hypothetical protein HN789_02340 [archaeon]|nr:hypothetical protein [archaeon]MBT4021897.1 hypothetical protein [archaeon]MBT4272192.1 hypothetical protein [archaeon]MBT4461714.1 hypothetical protein [archaeon]MBT4858222.1 hypothetical protein [archaeon]